MPGKTAVTVGSLLLLALPLHAEVPVTLRGSPESMIRQNRIALEGDYDFMRTPAQISAAVDAGALVPLEGNENYTLAYRSFPYGRPELRYFVERLAEQYHAGCGERLYVTSLTRPISKQPANAHPLSVHPAGLAVDLRISQNVRCQRWLEGELLGMEAQGLLDITREQRPPHYHVALFPEQYLAHVLERMEEEVFDVQLAGARVAQVEGERLLDPESAAGVHALTASRAGDESADTERRSWTTTIARVLTFPARLVSRLWT